MLTNLNEQFDMPVDRQVDKLVLQHQSLKADDDGIFLLLIKGTQLLKA